jgi:thiosulfate sulfurtransferase
MNPPEIDPRDALALLEQGEALFVDIRDPASHASARIRDARPLSQANVEDFLASTDRSRTLVVYCYHGRSSLDATAFLQSEGFEGAISLSGGFEHWRQVYPDTCVNNP